MSLTRTKVQDLAPKNSARSAVVTNKIAISCTRLEVCMCVTKSSWANFIFEDQKSCSLFTENAGTFFRKQEE